MNALLTNILSLMTVLPAFAAGPADCAHQAKHLVPSISEQQILELCKGARDSAPAQCLYEIKQKNPASLVEFGVELCKPVMCK